MTASEHGPVTIRPARHDDISRIYDITKAAFGPFAMAKLLEDRFGQIDGKAWYEHKAGDVAAGCAEHLDHVAVAEVAGRVVGYATWNGPDEPGAVGNNAVDPDHQGRGIGTALIRHALVTLRQAGHEQFQVTTMEHDRPARRIYEKWGFRECGRTGLYARRTPHGVERASADVADADRAAAIAADGFQLLAVSVHYRMTLADLDAALGYSARATGTPQ